MHPTLSEVFAGLARSRASLRAAVDSVPLQLRDQQPGADRWSVAGVLEHLSMVDERFTGIISRKLAEARAAGLGREQDSVPLLPATVLAMLEDRSERRPAPEPLHPRGLRCEEAWARLDAARTALRDMLAAADGLAISEVIHEHPRFGALNPYQWAGFLAAHELRHAEQIKEIASQLAAR